MTRRYIRIGQLASTPDKEGRWPVSAPTVWRWAKNGLLAPPVRLGPGVTAWPLEVIETFERERGMVQE